MKKFKLFLFLFLTGINFLKSQDLPKIIPPSPEAASLIKHSQVGVSLYTGTPNISIPFYTISSRGIQIPIGLSYSSGGVKVEDIASWIGLGWNLNTGGLVSRSLRGLPDDGTYGYMNTQYTVQDLLSRDPNSMNSNGQTFQLLSNISHQRDYEADTFNFSFPGGSGQFVYDQTLNKFIQLGYSNLKIETKKENSRIVGFIITSDNGIQYHFGKSSNNLRLGQERIISSESVALTPNGFVSAGTQTYGSSSEPYFQTWMLMDVVFPTSDETIEFYYTVEQNVKTTIRTNEKYVVSNCSPDAGLNINFLKKQFTQPKISQIIFPEGKIIFEKSNLERLDLHNSFPLKKIKLLDSNNRFIKGIELMTTMNQTIDINSVFDYYDEGKYRLILNSVKQFDSNSNYLNPYTLEYSSTNLPDRYSKSMDYFGYYNGKNNPSLIPKAKYNAPSGYFGNADRSVDPAFTQANILKKITYPTGGYDEFIWDNNSVSFFEGNPSNYLDFLTYTSEYFTNDSQLYPDNDPNIDYSMTFTISPNSNGIVNFMANMTGCVGNFNNTSCDYTLKVKGISNSNFNLHIVNPNFEYTFPVGTYKITAKINNSTSGGGNGCDPLTDPNCMGSGPPGGGGNTSSGNSMFGVAMNWTTDPTPNEYIFGGLRIAQINTYKDSNILSTSRTFNYDSFNLTNDISSGFSLSFPNFVNYNYKGGGSCGNNENFTTAIYSSVPSQLQTTKGSYVGYKNVSETFVSQQGNGKKQYTFSAFLGSSDNLYPTTYYNSPFPGEFKTPIYRDWRSGNLEKTEIFNNENELLSLEINEYETTGTYHSPYFGIEIIKMPSVYGINGSSIDAMLIAKYSFSTEWYRLKKKISTNYYDTSSITSVSNYLYGSNFMKPSEINTLNSKGDVIKSVTRYAGDIGNTSLIYQNRISEPLNVKSYINPVSGKQRKLSEQNTTYLTFNGNYLPQKIQTSKGSQSLEDRINYHNYDEKGNPLEVSKKDGTHIVYIWGYNKTQPIAKIENATYSQVSGQVSNLQNKSNLDNTQGTVTSENNLRTALTALRNSLPNAQVTTFTYDSLIGVTSVTDPRGRVMYYEYDSFNRLKQVKDQDGNILSKNEYNYKN